MSFEKRLSSLVRRKTRRVSFRFVLDKSEGSNEPRPSLSDQSRHWMRWAMAIFYFVAGVVHLRHPEAFLPIMPDWVPAPREVHSFHRRMRDRRRPRAVDAFASMVGGRYACSIRSLRFSSEHRACRRQHSVTAVADRLAVSCAALASSAGYHLVGAVLWRGRQLAIWPPPFAELATQ